MGSMSIFRKQGDGQYNIDICYIMQRWNKKHTIAENNTTQYKYQNMFHEIYKMTQDTNKNVKDKENTF